MSKKCTAPRSVLLLGLALAVSPGVLAGSIDVNFSDDAARFGFGSSAGRLDWDVSWLAKAWHPDTQLPEQLKQDAIRIRDAMEEIMNAGAKGEW